LKTLDKEERPMETTITLPNPYVSGPSLSQAAGRKVYGLSSPDPLSLSPRQTEALLPSALNPVGQGDGQQDVSSNKQEQSRLEDIRQMADKANAYMQMADTHLEFKVSQDTGQVIITVVNSSTNEVIRQIPQQSLSRFSKQLSQMRGLLFEAQG